ncbi:MAG: hypothetical protein GX922_01180 [Firmicutes bacterium]|nr:hypothetical protein [Bacillota bacterium]
MLLSGADQDKEEQLNLLAQLLEEERERLALIIKEYGIASKEAFLQSHVVDRLVIHFLQKAADMDYYNEIFFVGKQW